MLKQGGASRVGSARTIEAPHADGGVVKVEIQVGHDLPLLLMADLMNSMGSVRIVTAWSKAPFT